MNIILQKPKIDHAFDSGCESHCAFKMVTATSRHNCQLKPIRLLRAYPVTVSLSVALPLAVWHVHAKERVRPRPREPKSAVVIRFPNDPEGFAF
jgi:hypothetical protein